mmetsp:Transcript_14405/g.37925  ORF Transcript_14405/g.37925 Transcript_14405/m.37925 type:complete len:145 (-) Transcript_14405:389-823(-)|eukprot:CAMPEP_0119470762 /NCGR_PEP_ID=MMETSP1344-20130328/3523_1 /TAXON_ID=236787 /ORGANISM="Florenciella parvula, Strain CCMP2471" /LENGTH=144 /DNA_ID=CAMNT_0007503473 /DNA_START=339 /DNA_END=773 /DNA_ORIENTATION=-
MQCECGKQISFDQFQYHHAVCQATVPKKGARAKRQGGDLTKAGMAGGLTRTPSYIVKALVDVENEKAQAASARSPMKRIGDFMRSFSPTSSPTGSFKKNRSNQISPELSPSAASSGSSSFADDSSPRTPCTPVGKGVVNGAENL